MVGYYGSFIRFFVYTTDEDRLAYQRLLEQSDGPQANDAMAYQARQDRYHVHKQLFLVEEGKRLQFRLWSDYSEMVIEQSNGKADIVERFKNMTCLTQEKLMGHEEPIQSQSISCPPTQLIRYLQANAAVYSYRTKEMNATQVQLSRYLAPGHDLPLSFEEINPIMQGMAKHVQFSLAADRRLFKASEFQGVLLDAEQAL